MKRPLFNLEQRELIRLNTVIGAGLELNLAVMKFRREIHRDKGCIIARIQTKRLLKYISQILFNH